DVVGPHPHEPAQLGGADAVVEVQPDEDRVGRGGRGDAGLVRPVERHDQVGRPAGQGPRPEGVGAASGGGDPAGQGEGSGTAEQAALEPGPATQVGGAHGSSVSCSGAYSSSAPEKARADTVNSCSPPSASTTTRVTSWPVSTGSASCMSIRWSPPGSRACSPPAGTTKPSSASR